MEKIYLTSDIGKGNSIICKVSLILMKSFMQKCLVGSAMLSEIDDYKKFVWKAHSFRCGMNSTVYVNVDNIHIM